MTKWTKASDFEFKDVLYERRPGVARVTINRPEVMNAFRAQTVRELVMALEDAGCDDRVGVVVLTGAGNRAFCVGGDANEAAAGYSAELLRNTNRIHQIIREMPKPVIAAVNGYAIGGGQVFQQVCDLSIASEDAKLGQVGPKVGSYDGAFGAAYLTRLVGEKKAREIWYMCRTYTAKEAVEMGLVNVSVPPDRLEAEVDRWCDELLEKSPGALRALKEAFNLQTAELRGLEMIMGDLLWKYYSSAEALEWKKSFWEKRPPEWEKFRRREQFPGQFE